MRLFVAALVLALLTATSVLGKDLGAPADGERI